MRIIKLPLPSNHVLRGPHMTLIARDLLLRYDYAVDTTPRWVEMRFRDVMRVGYCNFSVCSADVIMGHDYMTEEIDNAELRLARDRRREFLGPNDFANAEDVAEPLRMFKLYCDDVAAIEVVARAIEGPWIVSDEIE